MKVYVIVLRHSIVLADDPLQVAFYFAFLQSYFKFLIFPAVFGFSCWLLLGSFSIIYTIVNSLWCIIFVEYWKRQEVDLGCRWQTKGVSAVRTKRREFLSEKEVRDEGTGETRGVFPAQKRMSRQLLQVPFAALASVALGVIIATCFAIEIFISEVYSGPLKTYLVGLHLKLVPFKEADVSGLHPYHSPFLSRPNYECCTDVCRYQTQRL